MGTVTFKVLFSIDSVVKIFWVLKLIPQKSYGCDMFHWINACSPKIEVSHSIATDLNFCSSLSIFLVSFSVFISNLIFFASCLTISLSISLICSCLRLRYWPDETLLRLCWASLRSLASWMYWLLNKSLVHGLGLRPRFFCVFTETCE